MRKIRLQTSRDAVGDDVDVRVVTAIAEAAAGEAAVDEAAVDEAAADEAAVVEAVVDEVTIRTGTRGDKIEAEILVIAPTKVR